MSKVGKKIIDIPQGVTIGFENNAYLITGPKGSAQVKKLKGVEITQSGNTIMFQTSTKDTQSIMNWGTQRALMQNALIGITQGFTKNLEMEGVGFRAAVQNKTLELRVGFSHPVIFPIPEGIAISIEKNKIIINGIEKDLVGQVAANIRKIKKPEPYLGKGIHYEGEVIRRKAGKKAATTK